MIFDTHCHMQFEEYADIPKELQLMKDYGVNYAALIGSDYESTEQSLALSKKYSNLFTVAGICHPIESPTIADLNSEISRVDKQIEENRKFIVGIGEAGFDYFHLTKGNEEAEKAIQSSFFEENVKLAKKYDLPLVIHTRDAWEDIFKYIEKFELKKFVVHCYTGNLEQAHKFLSLSSEAYIGFSGIVTFKNAPGVQDAAKHIPLNRILVETDSPYLAPAPHRGKQNTPAYTKYVLDKIIELREEEAELIEKTIYENSLRFYSVK